MATETLRTYIKPYLKENLDSKRTPDVIRQINSYLSATGQPYSLQINGTE